MAHLPRIGAAASGGVIQAARLANMLVVPRIEGDCSTFAIESFVLGSVESLSQLGVGYFCIFVGGKRFGLNSPDATLLGCSEDAVRRLIERRGKHIVVAAAALNAAAIVNTFQVAEYSTDRMIPASAVKLKDRLYEAQAVWAPDGDAGFDDGGHVLHFDEGKTVRLIGFLNKGESGQTVASIREVHLDADRFYAILGRWLEGFHKDLAESVRYPEHGSASWH